ncbi:hypothetical protein LINPERPRIM_LOCUS20564 [Linum perenne]
MFFNFQFSIGIVRKFFPEQANIPWEDVMSLATLWTGSSIKVQTFMLIWHSMIYMILMECCSRVFTGLERSNAYILCSLIQEIRYFARG